MKLLDLFRVPVALDGEIEPTYTRADVEDAQPATCLLLAPTSKLSRTEGGDALRVAVNKAGMCVFHTTLERAFDSTLSAMRANIYMRDERLVLGEINPRIEAILEIGRR
jgi:hypothetical protein